MPDTACGLAAAARENESGRPRQDAGRRNCRAAREREPGVNEALFDAAQHTRVKSAAPRRRPPKPEGPPAEVRQVREIPRFCLCQWEGYYKAVTASRNERWLRIEEVHPLCDTHGTPGAASRALDATEPYFKRAEDACCGAVFKLDLDRSPAVYRCPACGREYPRENIISPAEDPWMLPSRRLAAGGRKELLTPAQEADVDGLLF